MFLKIGILYEGDYDERPIQNVIKNVISKNIPGCKLEFVNYPARGSSIINKIKAAMFKFFNMDNCDLAVCVADLDKDKNKCKELHQKYSIESKSLNCAKPFAIGCPEPTLEAWFTVEQNALKNVLNIDGSKSLECTGLNPKDCVKHLYNKYAKVNKSMSYTLLDLYAEVSDNLNLSMLQRDDTSFSNFHREILNVLSAFKV